MVSNAAWSSELFGYRAPFNSKSLPATNAAEAALVHGVSIYPVSTLAEGIAAPAWLTPVLIIWLYVIQLAQARPKALSLAA